MIKFDKYFLSKTLKIMIPIAMQNLIFSSLNMVDTLMIGQLGQNTIAGVALANQFFFILSLIYFGITGGSAIFTSQFWGAKKIDKIINIFGISLKITFYTGVIFTIPALLFPKLVLSIFTNDSNVILLGAKYLQIVSLCYIFSGLTFITTGILRSIGQVKLPTIISAISLLINTIINYLLIFGSFGFPQLGIIGAAIATLFSRIIELILIILVLKNKSSPLINLKRSDFTLKGDLKDKYYKTIIPVVLNEGLWAAGSAMYSAIYARISTASVAAYQIQQTVTTIFLIFVFGIGNASGILIGNKLGEGEKESTYEYGKKFIKLSIFIGILTGILVYFIAPHLATLFKVNNTVMLTTRKLITLFSIILVFKSLNITMVVGVLRGGGDTKVAMLMDILGVWGIGMPLGLIGAFILKQPIEVVYILVSIEEIVKGIYGIYRLKSKKWINNLSV